MSDFDVAVIGAGPGGMDAALRAAELGFKTALVEKDFPGGTCLNTGCIPTKAMLASSRYFAALKEAETFGCLVNAPESRWKKILQRKNEVVERLRKAAAAGIEKSGVDWIQGRAFFADAKTLAVETKNGKKSIHANSIIIAAGSEPMPLPGFEVNGKDLLSSTQALSLEELPKSILIVGAGAVGVEFASLFNDLGIEVHLVEMLEGVLPAEDADCAKRLETILMRKGMKIYTGTKIEKFDRVPTGMQAKLSGGEKLSVEKILVAVGRRRMSDALGLDKAGIRPAKNGAIPVNAFLETASPGIFAVGDVIDSPQLAHTASYEGILVAENLKRKTKIPVDYSAMPSCVYSNPEVMHVGVLSSGKDERIEVKIPFSAVGKSVAEGKTDGFFKLIVDANGSIRAAAAIGVHVTELIPEITLAIRHHLSVRDLAEAVHAHPTAAEVIQMSAREVIRRIPKNPA